MNAIPVKELFHEYLLRFLLFHYPLCLTSAYQLTLIYVVSAQEAVSPVRLQETRRCDTSKLAQRAGDVKKMPYQECGSGGTAQLLS